MTSGDQAPGQIGGSLDHDGVDDWIDFGRQELYDQVTDDITISFWVNPTSLANYPDLFTNGLGVEFLQRMGERQRDDRLRANGDQLISTSSVATGEWSYVVMSRSGSTRSIYINSGTADISDTFAAPINPVAPLSDPLRISSSAYPYSGLIDEVRLSSAARSAEWLLTEYNNQSDAGTFYTVFFEQEAPATPTIHLDASDIDGDGTPNVGDIGSATENPWQDKSTSDKDGTLNNFSLPGNGVSGWDGDGSVGDPYRLQFDGSNDYVSITSITGGYKSLSVWFKVDSGYSGPDYIFGTSSTANQAYVKGGTLYATYDGGGTHTIGVSPETWYQYTVTNDGATERHYLNGVEFSSESDTPVTGTLSMGLGSYYFSSPSGTLDGAIASFRTYDDTLTPTQVGDLYAEDRGRFTADPGSAQIDRILPAVGTTAGGTTVTIYGWHLAGTTDVTFDGVSGTNLTVVSDWQLTVDTPAGSVGPVDVTVTTAADGSHTATDGFSYTATAVDNLIVWLDATNIDAAGAQGDGVTSDTWSDLISGGIASVNNVAQPTSGASGWDGDGTIGDPYRLQLDGSNDYVNVGSIAGGYKSLSVWFKVDSGYSGSDYIFSDGANSNRAYVAAGNLYATYDGGGTHSIGVGAETWYHYAVTSDGVTERHYLNGVEFASESDTAVTNTVDMALGSYYSYTPNGTLDGAISDFRIYSDTLTPGEVTAIYAEERTQFVADPGSAQIDRMIPAVGSNGRRHDRNHLWVASLGRDRRDLRRRERHEPDRGERRATHRGHARRQCWAGGRNGDHRGRR